MVFLNSMTVHDQGAACVCVASCACTAGTVAFGRFLSSSADYGINGMQVMATRRQRNEAFARH